MADMVLWSAIFLPIILFPSRVEGWVWYGWCFTKHPCSIVCTFLCNTPLSCCSVLRHYSLICCRWGEEVFASNIYDFCFIWKTVNKPYKVSSDYSSSGVPRSSSSRTALRTISVFLYGTWRCHASWSTVSHTDAASHVLKETWFDSRHTFWTSEWWKPELVVRQLHQLLSLLSSARTGGSPRNHALPSSLIQYETEERKGDEKLGTPKDASAQRSVGAVGGVLFSSAWKDLFKLF